jgi:hypothetical protein
LRVQSGQDRNDSARKTLARLRKETFRTKEKISEDPTPRFLS